MIIDVYVVIIDVYVMIIDVYVVSEVDYYTMINDVC